MAIHGTYNNENVYFPFEINGAASGSGANASDGTFIKSNMIYTLNVTLKKLGTGSEDPDIVNTTGNLDVTLTAQTWDGELIQDVEW